MRNFSTCSRAIAALCAGGLLVSPAFADGSTPMQLSAAGTASIVAAPLVLIASPFVMADELSEHGNPIRAAGAGLSTAAGAVALPAMGVVALVTATGKGLTELTLDSVDNAGKYARATGREIADMAPRVTVDVKTGRDGCCAVKKTIPLVVRKEYVQMNDKVQE